MQIKIYVLSDLLCFQEILFLPFQLRSDVWLEYEIVPHVFVSSSYCKLQNLLLLGQTGL